MTGCGIPPAILLSKSLQKIQQLMKGGTTPTRWQQAEIPLNTQAPPPQKSQWVQKTTSRQFDNLILLMAQLKFQRISSYNFCNLSIKSGALFLGTQVNASSLKPNLRNFSQYRTSPKNQYTETLSLFTSISSKFSVEFTSPVLELLIAPASLQDVPSHYF